MNIRRTECWWLTNYGCQYVIEISCTRSLSHSRNYYQMKFAWFVLFSELRIDRTQPTSMSICLVESKIIQCCSNAYVTQLKLLKGGKYSTLAQKKFLAFPGGFSVRPLLPSLRLFPWVGRQFIDHKGEGPNHWGGKFPPSPYKSNPADTLNLILLQTMV